MDEIQDKLADSSGSGGANKEPIVVDTPSTLARLDEGKQIPILNSDRVDLVTYLDICLDQIDFMYLSLFV